MLETEYAKNLEVVIIQINKEKYLFEVKDVKEIYIPGENIVPIPLTDKKTVGIINIRGDIYSIISLKHEIYGVDTKLTFSKTSRIILLHLDYVKIAILVDSVIGVKSLPLSAFEGKSTIVETHIDYNLIKSIGVHESDSYILLDLQALIQPFLVSQDDIGLSPVEIEDQNPPLVDKYSELGSETKLKPMRLTTQKSQLLKHRVRKPKLTKSPMPEGSILTPAQLDTLQEIGNIGTGNAVTALSRLVKKRIDVDLTKVGIIPFDKISEQFGDPSTMICGIFSHSKSPTPSTIIQAFNMKPLLQVISSLTNQKSKINPNRVKTKKDLDEYTISTITEIGNILAGHYASALADLLETKIMIDIPEFTMTSAAVLGDFLVKELKSNFEFVIIIKTIIKISDLKLEGIFLFVPDYEALENIFNKLGVRYKSVGKELKHPIGDKRPKVSDLELTGTQKDALMEIGNIGAGNAANALAKMINNRVDINIPNVKMVELDKFASAISKKNEKLFVAWSNVLGKARATVLTIFKVGDILKIIKIIISEIDQKKINISQIKSIKDFPEIYKSAVSELSHILASHYASALGDLLDIRMMTDPPDMSIDTGAQLFKILKDEIGLLKKLSLVINTNILITDIKITGSFLYIPNLETLKNLLDALETFYE